MIIKYIEFNDYHDIPEYGMAKKLSPKPGLTIRTTQNQVEIETSTMLFIVPIHNVKNIAYIILKEQITPKIEFNLQEYQEQLEIENNKKQYKNKKK